MYLTEAVGLEEAQQLDHRLIAAGAIGATELGVLRRAEESGDLLAVLVNGQSANASEDGRHQQTEVASSPW